MRPVGTIERGTLRVFAQSFQKQFNYKATPQALTVVLVCLPREPLHK